MNTNEQLQRIKAECERLLALSSTVKDAPWKVNQGGHWIENQEGHNVALSYNGTAPFIAACAGPAEAGWCSTIAAIDTLISLELYIMPGSNAADLRDEILSIWEGLV